MNFKYDYLWHNPKIYKTSLTVFEATTKLSHNSNFRWINFILQTHFSDSRLIRLNSLFNQNTRRKISKICSKIANRIIYNFTKIIQDNIWVIWIYSKIIWIVEKDYNITFTDYKRLAGWAVFCPQMFGVWTKHLYGSSRNILSNISRWVTGVNEFLMAFASIFGHYRFSKLNKFEKFIQMLHSSELH